MNFLHHWLCSSGGWKTYVERKLIPWALRELKLGSHVLEIGPGFGATTDILRKSVRDLTCVEVDPSLASVLADRMQGSNVRVICEDATSTSLNAEAFDAVVCFTMLHHIPSSRLQDRLFAEATRVLRPGGIFAGTDILSGWGLRLLHVFDTLVPVDPGTLAARLQAAGLADVHVDVNGPNFRFRARKPPAAVGTPRNSELPNQGLIQA